MSSFSDPAGRRFLTGLYGSLILVATCVAYTYCKHLTTKSSFTCLLTM